MKIDGMELLNVNRTLTLLKEYKSTLLKRRAKRSDRIPLDYLLLTYNEEKLEMPLKLFEDFLKLCKKETLFYEVLAETYSYTLCIFNTHMNYQFKLTTKEN